MYTEIVISQVVSHLLTLLKVISADPENTPPDICIIYLSQALLLGAKD